MSAELENIFLSAVFDGDKGRVKEIFGDVNKKKKLSLANLKNVDGQTVLMTALQEKHADIMKLLLKNQADVFAQDKFHVSVFDYAVHAKRDVLNEYLKIIKKQKFQDDLPLPIHPNGPIFEIGVVDELKLKYGKINKLGIHIYIFFATDEAAVQFLESQDCEVTSLHGIILPGDEDDVHNGLNVHKKRSGTLREILDEEIQFLREILGISDHLLEQCSLRIETQLVNILDSQIPPIKKLAYGAEVARKNSKIKPRKRSSLVASTAEHSSNMKRSNSAPNLQISANGSGRLPPNWEARMDPKTGQLYYRNKITKNTQWECPEVEPPPQPRTPKSKTPKAKPPRRNSKSQKSDSVNLPLNWETRIDPKSGRVYFRNTSTKTTQWEHPSAAVNTEEPKLPTSPKFVSPYSSSPSPRRQAQASSPRRENPTPRPPLQISSKSGESEVVLLVTPPPRKSFAVATYNVQVHSGVQSFALDVPVSRDKEQKQQLIQISNLFNNEEYAFTVQATDKHGAQLVSEKVYETPLRAQSGIWKPKVGDLVQFLRSGKWDKGWMIHRVTEMEVEITKSSSKKGYRSKILENHVVKNCLQPDNPPATKSKKTRRKSVKVGRKRSSHDESQRRALSVPSRRGGK